MPEQSHRAPLVVGLGGSGHEWATCAALGDRVVAVAEERVTRRKYGLGSDLLAGHSRKACLESLAATGGDVTQAVACDLVPRSFTFPLRDRLEVIGHHLAHAHCAFATSGLERAAILVVDNAGSILDGAKTGRERAVETVSLFDAGPDGITLIERFTGIHRLDAETESDFYQAGATTDSLGHFYRSASLALGFSFRSPIGGGVFSEDGKTMGLSPYGDNRYHDEVAALVSLDSASGGLRVDPQAVDAVFARCLHKGTFDERAALAAAVQSTLETALLHLARRLHALTGHDALCIAGGVALNSVANGRLARETPFRTVYVPPAPSDDGIALGCAAYGLWTRTGRRPRFARSAYLGPERPATDGAALARDAGLTAERPDDLIATVAGHLAAGRIVAWFQGRSEYGPRALGHRSILALPSPGFVRDKLNHEMKRREWFRPYAPMVPLEATRDYFDFPGESPHMSFVAPVLRPADLPAATHVDGTARLQTVAAEDNPRIHALLGEIGRRTGTPILLNTSFNRAGEPIVETPAEALESARAMTLDLLVVDDWIIPL